MSTIPLHPQTFERADVPGFGQAVLALVVTTRRVVVRLCDPIAAAGRRIVRPRHSAEARALEARQQAIERLANDPHFIAGL